MFEKHLEDSENPTTQEVLFYVQLLVDQNEVPKAISLVEGPFGKKVNIPLIQQFITVIDSVDRCSKSNDKELKNLPSLRRR
jgi:hypothetical protein